MTSAGAVEIETVYGQDAQSGEWLNPLRLLLGLDSRQEMSPVLEEKLCFTATLTGSYEQAAEVAGKWGVEVDKSTIHTHVQLAGDRASAKRQERVERALDPSTRAEVVCEAGKECPPGEFSLVIMMDGWMVRERGPQWGLKPPDRPGERVSWHEMKSAIVFRVEQRAVSQSGRRMIVEKYYVSQRGGPDELGREIYAEALRRGLNQAKRVYVVADGAVWIWNVVEDRFPQAVGVLDFYHASEHLWAVAREMFKDDDDARAFVEPLLHSLNHGREARVLKTLANLSGACAGLSEESRRIVDQNVQYFDRHREHMHYHRVAKQGCPKGSGAMESTCSQLQGRFKRTGQFWTIPGEARLMALELARRNDDWDEIWEYELVA